MKNKKPTIGDALKLGLIPCRVCNERHVESIVQLKPLMTSWEMNGHFYNQKNEREYIQEQRDFMNKLMRINRQLKSRIHKLKNDKT